jgi:hypothetical protein
MSKKITKRRHSVLVGEDFRFFRDAESRKADEITEVLEQHFPSATVDFTLKLLPLSVGACLLIIGESGPANRKGHKHRRAESIDCEVIESELMELKSEQVLAIAEELIKRWQARLSPRMTP